jgi:ABC-type uncharacterized transport system permease subunit
MSAQPWEQRRVTANLTIAFGIVLIIAVAAAAARQFSAPGVRRNVFSVILVVAGLIATFLFCFGLGTMVRKPEPPKVSAATPLPSRASPRPSDA